MNALPPQERVSSAFRAPPANLDAEKALLGAIMMNNRAYEKVSDFLRPEHFADQINGIVYGAMCKLIDQGRQATPVTLKDALMSDPVFEQAGGLKYIAHIASYVITIINAGDYGRLIYDLHLRRELIAFGDNCINEAFEVRTDDSALNLIERREAELFKLNTSGAVDDRLAPLSRAMTEAVDLAEAAYKREGKLSGVTTGLADLDRMLGGLHRSDLVILAGRPSMGKTALATTIAFRAAEHFAATDDPEQQGKVVAFFSLEMSRDQLATRILAHRARLPSHNIRNGAVSQHDFGRIVSESQRAGELPLWVDDTAAITAAAIRSRCRRIAHKARKQADGTSKGGLGLIVVDYLQLMSPGHAERPENRVQEVSAMTRGLKVLAKELNVPVVVLSQLSRAVEMREDKRPQLADLRESGSIEQDADVVMFVYREQYYLERAEPQQKSEESDDRFIGRRDKWQEALNRCHNVAECIVAKQRHGPIGTARLRFDPQTTWFDDLAPHEAGQADLGV